MKAGFCTNCIKDVSLEDALPVLAELGYDGVEFWDKQICTHDLEELKAVLDRVGLECAQVCPYFDFTGGEEKWERSIWLAEEYIQIAEQLGAQLIRTFTGTVSSKEATDKHWSEAVSGLRSICELGRDKNIAFALEMHSGHLADTSDSALRLLEQVGASNLGVNLQLPVFGEDVWDTIKVLEPYTIHVHAHNWMSLDGGRDLTFLDSGNFDFDRFAQYLYERGYRGYVSIEHATHYGRHTWQETAAHEIAYLKRLFESLASR
jgi:3-dehydroshikimate dehydratase